MIRAHAKTELSNEKVSLAQHFPGKAKSSRSLFAHIPFQFHPFVCLPLKVTISLHRAAEAHTAYDRGAGRAQGRKHKLPNDVMILIIASHTSPFYKSVLRRRR